MSRRLDCDLPSSSRGWCPSFSRGWFGPCEHHGAAPEVDEIVYRFLYGRFRVDFFAALALADRAARAFTRFWASLARVSGDIGLRFLATFLVTLVFLFVVPTVDAPAERPAAGRASATSIAVQVTDDQGGHVGVRGFNDLHIAVAQGDSIFRHSMAPSGRSTVRRGVLHTHLDVTNAWMTPRR